MSEWLYVGVESYEDFLPIFIFINKSIDLEYYLLEEWLHKLLKFSGLSISKYVKCE